MTTLTDYTTQAQDLFKKKLFLIFFLNTKDTQIEIKERKYISSYTF